MSVKKIQMDRPRTVHIVRTERTANSSNNEHCRVKIRIENTLVRRNLGLQKIRNFGKFCYFL